MVTTSANVAPVALNTSEPLKVEAGAAPGGGTAACWPPISPAWCVKPSIRCIQRSTGRILRSTTWMVRGALASHC